MIEIVMTVTSSNFDGSQGAQDQGDFKEVHSTEKFTFHTRGDSSGMPEIDLANRIRNFLDGERLR